jgi:hypothetical protein
MSEIAVPTASLGAVREKRRAIRVTPLLFFLALVAGLLGVSEKMLQDPDTQWHIAVGRWIWESRAVPWIDVFSHTFAGADWIAKEWLSQLIFYGAFAAAGWRGVAALTAIVIAGSFALLFRWLRSRINSTVALLLAGLAFDLATIGMLARPQVLVFPILILWTGGLVEAAARGSPPWRLVALMTLWANLHGSFTIGFVLAGILAVEAMLAVPRQQRPAAALRWSVFLAAVVLAACVTPYGYRSMWVTATLFGNLDTLKYIDEWQPLRFYWIGILAYGMLISLLLGLALRPRENLFRIIIVVLFGYIMLSHQRFASLFALVAPIIAVGPLARLLPSLAPSVPERRTDLLPRLAATGLLLVALGIGLLKSHEPISSTTPAAALRAARALGIAGPVYNDYDFGGFLISQGVSTFIDGRTELFLGGFINGLDAALSAADGTAFTTLLDSRGVTWALVKPDSNAIRHLDALPGWRRAYGDDTAVVYTRLNPPDKNVTTKIDRPGN